MTANLTTRLGQLTSSPAGGPYTGANKIINGDMAIDQRNAGASVTPTAGQYSVDRMRCALSAASKYTVQQDGGSLTVPAGATHWACVVSSSSYSLSAGDYFAFEQFIEGQNIADLNWGTANAKTVTLSFLVQSTLTGTFGGSLENSASNRSYPFTYTISAANTWEQKSITVAGDTTGTWLTTTGIGIRVQLGLGVGTTYSGTAGAWAAADYLSATGAVSVVSTSGAKLAFTNLKLEVGSIATPFVPDDYAVSLDKCKRYYRKIIYAASSWWAAGAAYATTAAGSGMTWYPTMRAAPTVTLPSTINWDNAAGGAISGVTTTVSIIGLDNFRIGGAAASGWVAGNATLIEFSGNLIMDAEL